MVETAVESNAHGRTPTAFKVVAGASRLAAPRCGRWAPRTPAGVDPCTSLPTTLLDQPDTFHRAEEGGVEPPRLALVPLRTGCRHHVGWLLQVVGLAGLEPAASASRTR